MPSIRNRMFLGLVTLALAGAAVANVGKADAPPAGELESILTMHVDGDIVIDPAGALTSFDTAVPMPPELRSRLDKVIGQLRFEPVVIDGTARNARSKIRVVLAATPAGADYLVRVDNVLFPAGPEELAATMRALGKPAPIEGARLTPPQYPSGLMRAGVAGRVLLGILVDADGKPEKITAVQSMLYDVKGRDKSLRLGLEIMEKSALSAARRWTFEVPPARAGMSPEERTVTVPVEYRLDRGPAKDSDKPSGKWRTVVRAPQREMDWLPKKPGLQRTGVADVLPGEVVPTEGALRLATAVAGTVLM